MTRAEIDTVKTAGALETEITISANHNAQMIRCRRKEKRDEVWETGPVQALNRVLGQVRM